MTWRWRDERERKAEAAMEAMISHALLMLGRRGEHWGPGKLIDRAPEETRAALRGLRSEQLEKERWR